MIDQKRAAELLGVSPRVMAAWRRRGKGPFYVKRGPYIRYAYEHLIDFLANQPPAIESVLDVDAPDQCESETDADR